MDLSYLSNVALVSTFYEQNRNYFDVYLPFIVKSLQNTPICNLEQVLENLYGIFQFNLPINVLKTIIDENEGKTLSSKRKSSNWEIFLTTSGKELLGNIVEDERKTADELTFLYRSANDYFGQKGLAQLSDSEMSSAISKFLLANLAHFMNKRAIHLEDQSGEFDLNFVKYLFDVAFADRNIETIIEKMWKGLILLNSMSNDKSRKRVDAFSQTLELYIDTNVVFSLLGLHNPIFSRGISELFQLIKRIPQIKVYVFDETLAEFERLLDVFDRIKDSFYEIEVDSVFYYLKKNKYDRSKILVLKDSMEALLSEKGISIRNARGLENDISEYYMKLFGDIYGFRKARNGKLPVDSQKNDDQLQKSSHHDAKVISNVLALKNKRTRNIQEAKALFLTSSGSLYSDYLRIARKIENYPCVIRDIALTNWLYVGGHLIPRAGSR